MTNNLNNNPHSFKSKIQIIEIYNEILKTENPNSYYYKFVKHRRNALYTTLFFYRFDQSKEKISIPKNINAKVDLKTLLREIKRIYF